MPIDYLKMARECRAEAAAKESRLQELRREYRCTGRYDVCRRITVIESLRDELMVQAHVYEKRADKKERIENHATRG